MMNPIMTYNPRVDYTINLHPDLPTIGNVSCQCILHVNDILLVITYNISMDK